MSVMEKNMDRVTHGEPVREAPADVEHLIACVLRRAHRSADARNRPDDARTILHVAHSFADELGMLNPGFDRLRFIEKAIDYPS